MEDRLPLSAGIGPGRACLFLDVDGTLLDLVRASSLARVPPTLVVDLGRVLRRLGGALALVSGRPVAELDELFRPLHLPAAGVHGLERRFPGRTLQRRDWSPDALGRAREQVQALVAGCAGVRLEFKPGALALHYRERPEAGGDLRSHLARLAQGVREDYALIDGDMVLEFVPRGCSKASAIDEFMARPPFRGRRPYYLGDDATDVGAFEAVRRYDGIDVAVGDRVTARWRLPGPPDVRRWIASLAAAGPGAA